MGSGPGAGGRGRWFLLPVLGVAMLLLAGAGAFFGARSYEGSRASQSCGSYSCIPRLEAETVVKALQDQGHTCTVDSNHRSCELHIGFVRFRASLQVSDELIHAMTVDVYRAAPVGETGLAYLNWFATLPYAGDPETSAQIEEWVAEQVNGNKDTRAVIGDYQYRLTNPETYAVELSIRGNF
ncbi:hypothetical protein GCM10022225_08700 [Plantactinospora mayteni]|uniref:Uncharacterized protein n=1 Tax=Plantactinospora mayteni TaxID=566021 RepID=A0ABQ4EI28_9ACTN|nr:hypothetical protein [Plantactinospora mayteni]GIG94383.1 hypothetical protein Pma05_09560 [Plantactinospora mayteni]